MDNIFVTNEMIIDYFKQALAYINRAIEDRNFAHLSTTIPYSKFTFKDWYNEYLDGQICVAAILNNQCIGLSHLEQEHGRRSVNCYLALTVEPNYHRIGVGKKILKKIENLARLYGLVRITAEPNAENKTAIQFLLKQGYEIEGELKCAFKKNDHDLVSRLILGKIL